MDEGQKEVQNAVRGQPDSQSASQPDHGRIAQALKVLAAGGVVGYPSETVWGLAALTTSAAGLERLYARKGRVEDKPVQLSCLDAATAEKWLRPGQEGAEKLFQFWPGPLTLLAWAREGCPERLAPGGVVGLRVPAHEVIRALLQAAGGTLATTSLNPSGEPSASSEVQARAYGLADLLLSSSEVASSSQGGSGLRISGLSSTVFDLRTRQVLRAGAVSEAELLTALA